MSYWRSTSTWNPIWSSFSQRPRDRDRDRDRDRPTTRSTFSIDNDDEEMTPPTPTDYKTIPTWIQHYKNMVEQETFRQPIQALQDKYGGKNIDHGIASLISIWRGDITKLTCDAIVNAANTGLWAGGGVCGAIHSAAGSGLARECDEIGGCRTGRTVMTGGYRLPSRHVLHTVGPTCEDDEMLHSCYITLLDLCVQHGIRSVAIPCVATGIYGFPNAKAALIALSTVREWLEQDQHRTAIDRIIFVTFMDQDVALYNSLPSLFFPVDLAHADDLTYGVPVDTDIKSDEIKSDAAAADVDTTHQHGNDENENHHTIDKKVAMPTSSETSTATSTSTSTSTSTVSPECSTSPPISSSDMAESSIDAAIPKTNSDATSD